MPTLPMVSILNVSNAANKLVKNHLIGIERVAGYMNATDIIPMKQFGNTIKNDIGTTEISF